ncbi:Plectin/S10 domain-containing protein [Trametes elegans]|nr:Plectin/S10 domain-containing protein [Trametes elegans]
MIISKQNRRIIYESLFKEGVLVAKKDYNAPKHEELDVPNLEVIKAMQSLTSKGLVKTQFSWQWYYYVLTPEGTDYLREWLNLPSEIVPATHKKAVRPPRPAQVRGPGGEGAYRAPRGDREDYRKKEGAPGEFRPQFAGVGRGAPRDPTHPPAHAAPPFRPSASLLTMLTILASFIILCIAASYGSTSFALAAARPAYALYPPLAAAMLVGGMCAWICYLPTTLAVLCFLLLFGTDIRARGTPPPAVRHAAPPVRWRPLLWSLLRDGADTIKLALVLVPVYVLAVGGAGRPHVEARALDAASGGQLAAATMTLKIMLVAVREIWGLVPLVVLRWDRDAHRGEG